MTHQSVWFKLFILIFLTLFGKIIIFSCLLSYHKTFITYSKCLLGHFTSAFSGIVWGIFGLGVIFFFMVVWYIKFIDLIVQNSLVDTIRTSSTCSCGQLFVFRERFPVRSCRLVQFPTGRDTGNCHPSPSTPAPPKIIHKNTILYLINFRRINHNRTIITKRHNVDNRWTFL